MITSLLTFSIIVVCILVLVFVARGTDKRKEEDIKDFWSRKLKEAEEQEKAFKQYADEYVKTKNLEKTPIKVSKPKKSKPNSKSKGVEIKKMSAKSKKTKKSIKNEVH